MLRIFTYAAPDVLANQDVLAAPDVLAGLVWTPGRPASFLRRAPLALTWADRTALVPDAAEYLGLASLLSCLTGCLDEEKLNARVLVAFADDPAAPLSGLQASPAEAVDDPAQNLFFAAVLVNGKPAIGPERLFDTREELITHIDVECCSGQIDRLATTAELAKDIHSPIPVSLLSNPEPGFEPAATAAPIIVEGKAASRLPVWQLAVGGISVLALAAGALLLFPVQQSKPTAALPVAAVQITSRDDTAFGRNCLAAFAGVWPLAPGWQLVSEGCATPEMRDPNLEGHAGLTGFAPTQPVAYRIWQLRRGFDPAIARKAAEAVTATRTRAATRATTASRATAVGSKITMVIQGNRMFSSTAIAAPMRG